MAFQFINYRKEMNLPDGIYNARYNKEPAIIRLKEGVPTYVSFIGYLDADGNSKCSSIYSAKGVLHSSVELLLPEQKIQINNP